MDSRRTPRARVPLWLSVEPVLDASSNAVLAVDGHGRIVYANPMVQRVFGWSPEELWGEPVERLVPSGLAEQPAAHRTGDQDQPSGRPGTVLAVFGRRRDGTEFPVEISLAPVRSQRGALVFATVVDVTTRVELQGTLAQVHEELRRHAEALEQRGRESSQLATMGDLLGACQSLDEAYAVVSAAAEPLFPGDAGALYAMKSPGGAAEVVAAWGSPPPARGVFPPTDCWALRRGHLHAVYQENPEPRCPHVEEPVAAGLLCVPLAAQTETLGLLHVQLRRRAVESAGPARHAEGLARTLGEQAAVALANIGLRSTLREQSLRDPLTGLFNRRYTEESFDREIRRATREGYGLGVLMADLDHFKELNDAFGHAAGDEMLRRIGRFLAGAVRGEDIACRLGGDEFVVILPKASLDDAQRRAEALREGIKVPPLDESRHLYPTMTMSVGVAEFPEHGTSVQQLLLAADSALYRAKALGRDQVVVAGGAEGRPVDVSAT